MSADLSQEFSELATRLRAWNGDAGTALELRERLLALPEQRRANAGDDEEAVRLAASLYGARPRFERALSVPHHWPALRVVIADAERPWPFHDPHAIDDDARLRWLAVVAVAVPDARTRGFVQTLFGARKRPIWTAASKVLGVLACSDPDSLEFLQAAWADGFPGGLPRDRMLSPEKRAPGPGGVHAARHALHCAAVFLAAGGSPASLKGFDLAVLLGWPLSDEPADASVQIQSWTALLASPSTGAAAEARFARLLNEEPRAELQVEEALREAHEVLRVPDALAAVRVTLVNPRWKTLSGADRFDGLWGWLDSARWFADRRDLDAVAMMRSSAEEAGLAVELATFVDVPPEDLCAADALVPRLRRVLDPTIAGTTPDRVRQANLAEALLLIRRCRDRGRKNEPVGFAWRTLITRVLGPEGAAEFAAGDVDAAGPGDLVLWLSEQHPGNRVLGSKRKVPAALTREALFEEHTLLRLASCQNEAVGRQVAVQVEQNLRHRGAEDRIRLLWRILLADPPARTFKELGVLLPAKSALRLVVAAMADLDGARDANAEPEQLLNAYAALGQSTADVLGVESHPAPEYLRALSRACARLNEPAEVRAGAVTAMHVIETCLFGQKPSLMTWLEWLDKSVPLKVDAGPPAAIRAAWDQVSEHWRAAQPGKHTSETLDSTEPPTPDELGALEGAMTALVERMRVHAWPESTLVQRAQGRVAAWCSDARRLFQEHRQALHAGVLRVDAVREWRQQAEMLLFGWRRGAGLVTDRDHPVVLVSWRSALRALDAAVAKDSGHDQFLEFDRTWDALASALAALGVDADVRAAIAARATGLVASRRIDVVARRDASASLRAAIDAANDDDVVRCADSEHLADDDLKRAGTFLLNHLRFSDADRLRQKAPSIPSRSAHLAPLFLSVTGGVLFVLDNGTAWNDAEGLGYAGITAISLGLSFLALVLQLANSMKSAVAERNRTRFWTAGKRVLPLFATLFAATTPVTTIVLLTLPPGEAPTLDDAAAFLWRVLLWSSLSMFLGIVFALILGGRKLQSESS